MSGPDVLIVGAGQSGFQLAASLREGGHDGRILLLGEEPELPYQRPPLSKAYLMGKADAPQLRFRAEAFYAENRLEVRTGARVVRVERDARRVLLGSGEALPYEHLVLATGARNRTLPVPGAALDGVAQLRTLAEAEALRRRIETARRAVVVGAGFIGLEFAAVAAARGLEVTVVEALDRPMARSVSPLVAAYFRSVHERAGVRFAFGAAVMRITGEAGRVTGVETGDGTHFPADLVLIGIGVVLNAELAAEAGLATADGIVVDALLRTEDPAISAIGDCARFPCRFAEGAPVRLESVQNAVDQARCVAARLLGRPAPYASLPWFWSDQGTLKLQIAGLSVPHDQAVVRGDPAAGQGFSVFCFRGGRLAGVESVNRPLDHVLARRILERGLGLTPAQAEDPAFDLKALAAAPGPGDAADAQPGGARTRAPGH